jgi:hypothetical protein
VSHLEAADHRRAFTFIAGIVGAFINRKFF